MPFKLAPSKPMGLCDTCREGTTRTHDNGDVVMLCDAGMNTQRVHRPVVRCSDYNDSTTTSKWDMEKIAWTVTTDKSGQTIGFQPPKKMEDR